MNGQVKEQKNIVNIYGVYNQVEITSKRARVAWVPSSWLPIVVPGDVLVRATAMGLFDLRKKLKGKVLKHIKSKVQRNNYTTNR